MDQPLLPARSASSPLPLVLSLDVHAPDLAAVLRARQQGIEEVLGGSGGGASLEWDTLARLHDKVSAAATEADCLLAFLLESSAEDDQIAEAEVLVDFFWAAKVRLQQELVVEGRRDGPPNHRGSQ